MLPQQVACLVILWYYIGVLQTLTMEAPFPGCFHRFCTLEEHVIIAAMQLISSRMTSTNAITRITRFHAKEYLTYNKKVFHTTWVIAKKRLEAL
ncbi:hypothetical protein L2E82_04738 [Cichorium intybus]|uniref:Uncharacterized protein n=1 Tax=Cichorium intybus TaxID=13427 RepID=A0ACB9H7I3_CICIN|nr:hypothetical protein L2E82_04738 [Cichorium intybus]